MFFLLRINDNFHIFTRSCMHKIFFYFHFLIKYEAEKLENTGPLIISYCKKHFSTSKTSYVAPHFIFKSYDVKILLRVLFLTYRISFLISFFDIFIDQTESCLHFTFSAFLCCCFLEKKFFLTLNYLKRREWGKSGKREMRKTKRERKRSIIF